MTDFRSRSTLLILATHMTIAITPAQERNFTCMHAASDTHVPAVTTRIHGCLTHRSETNVFSILTYMQTMSSSPNMHVVHLLYLTFSKSADMPNPIDNNNRAPGVWSSAVGGSCLNAWSSLGRLGSPET